MVTETERLKQFVPEAMESILQDKFAYGNAILVGCSGEILFEDYYGYQDDQKLHHVDQNTIWRLYSMTKVVTAIAVMQLLEKGSLRLEDDVCQYIPEFRNAIIRRIDGSVEKIRTPMMVSHLLTMTSGLTYDRNMEEQTKFVREYKQSVVQGKPWGTVDVARNYARVPLLFQPGESYCYGFSYDILGAIIELVSGMRLDEYFQKMIFDPLNLKNIGFSISGDNWSFLADGCCIEDHRMKKCTDIGDRLVDLVSYDQPTFFSGGAGLVSTLRDISAITMMLAQGGELHGTRILSTNSVEKMHIPRLTKTQKNAFNDPLNDPCSMGTAFDYGYGVRVLTDKEAYRSIAYASDGEWGWSGAMGTWMTISPSDKRCMIYMHQHVPTEHGLYIPRIQNALGKSMGLVEN